MRGACTMISLECLLIGIVSVVIIQTTIYDWRHGNGRANDPKMISMSSGNFIGQIGSCYKLRFNYMSYKKINCVDYVFKPEKNSLKSGKRTELKKLTADTFLHYDRKPRLNTDFDAANGKITVFEAENVAWQRDSDVYTSFISYQKRRLLWTTDDGRQDTLDYEKTLVSASTIESNKSVTIEPYPHLQEPSHRRVVRQSFPHNTRINDAKAPFSSREQIRFNLTDFQGTKMAVNMSDIGMYNLNMDNLQTLDNENVTQTFHLGALFDLSNTQGQLELYGALLAVEHITKANFVPGHRLQLLFNDTACSPGRGIDAFFDFIYRKPPIRVVIGGSCSDVTEAVAEIVPYFNLSLISHAATAHALSNRKKYPTFFRLSQADTAFNSARSAFISYFNWEVVGTLHEDVEGISLSINDVIKALEGNNVTVKETRAVKTGNGITGTLTIYKDLDLRIFVASFTETLISRVFCEMHRLGLYGPKYVWLILEPAGEWWSSRDSNTSCSRREVMDAAEGHFRITGVDTLLAEQKSAANMTTQEFRKLFLNRTSSKQTLHNVANAYDTVWTVAQALRTLKYDFNESYEDDAVAVGQLHDVIQNVKFLGVSGLVSFSGSDRLAFASVQQLQGGTLKQVALFNPENNSLVFNCVGCVPVVWKGGSIPRDQYSMVVKLKIIGSTELAIIGFCSVFGIVMAAVFLSFNLYHRKLKYIKMSSPRLNNVAVVGCLTVYAAIILVGLDNGKHAFFCSVWTFMLSVGFSLAFGATFTKTFRVHRIIIANDSRGLIKSKLLKDKQLLIMIGVLVILDSIIVALWSIIDPLSIQLVNSTQEISRTDPDTIIVYQVSKCHSHHVGKWTITLYAYKGVLLAFGTYMAWETRHVKIAVLNDSRYIGMNVYNVVITSITVVVLSYIAPDSPTLTYIMQSVMLHVSTTITLCLLFIPKIYAIACMRGEPAVAAAGINVTFNTRRFATDERKDVYARTEIQNRVYKRELLRLQAHLKQLQHLADMMENNDDSIPEGFDELLNDLSATPATASPRADFNVPSIVTDDLTTYNTETEIGSTTPQNQPKR